MDVYLICIQTTMCMSIYMILYNFLIIQISEIYIPGKMWPKAVANILISMFTSL